MKLTLRLIGFAGIVLFGLSLALTFLSPIHFERAARGYIESRIERQIRVGLGIVPGAAGETGASRVAAALAAQRREEIGALRERLARGLNAEVVAAVAQMQDLGCECRQRMREGLDAATQLRLSTIERAQPQLRRFIEGRYREIVADLLRDLRIFAGTNLLAFLLLLMVSIARPDRLRQLFVPGLLLAIATVTTSAIYLFGQDWFFTLLYGDFVGWTYGIWLLLIYGLFCDVALFKARITTPIVDAVIAVAGKAVPC